MCCVIFQRPDIGQDEPEENEQVVDENLSEEDDEDDDDDEKPAPQRKQKDDVRFLSPNRMKPLNFNENFSFRTTKVNRMTSTGTKVMKMNRTVSQMLIHRSHFTQDF